MLAHLLLVAFITFSNFAATAFCADQKAPEWELISNPDLDEKNGIILYRKEIRGSNLLAYKGHTTIDAPIAKVLSVVKDSKRRHEWVKYYEGGHVVEQVGIIDSIQYAAASPPWPIKNRDIVFRSTNTFDGKTRSFKIDTRSVDHKMAPTKAGKIRAVIHFSTITLSPVSKNKTFIEGEVHADPKGWIPSWIVNLVQKKWPVKTIRALEKQLKKENIKIDPRFAKFYP